MPAFGKASSVLKADFDIAFKNILRKYDYSALDFYGFLDALELMAGKIYKGQPLSYGIEQIITLANEYFDSNVKWIFYRWLIP